ncbi:ATP-binding protein [Streptomyces sp. NPDC059785]|uniref:ATP-binding protein n=1 Tax=unclassified Streptomyces TaxID=2593676 RepID=UPI00366481C4
MCGELRTHSGDTATLSDHRDIRGARTAAEARDAVRDALAEGFPGGGIPRDNGSVGDALLVASELTTNAILHGGGVTDFEVTVTDHELRLSVSDQSDRLPVATPGTDSSGRMRLGGHGWPIVCRLARDVVVSPLRNGGKRITAIVPLSFA